MRRRHLPLLAAIPFAAHAQSAWPTKPVRIVVTFPPGGSSDIVARILGDVLTQKLGQRVVVDNRPGAGGTLAAAHVAQQPADGYTLIISNTAPMVTSPPIYEKPGYDPIASFTHVSYIGYAPTAFISHPSVPARDWAGLVGWMRAQRSPPSYGSSGTGSVGHIVAEMFSKETGIALTHVPYRGSSPMQADLLGGQILLAVDTLPQNLEHIRAGRLIGFAVSSKERSGTAPNIPTTAEVGLPAIVAQNWIGLSAPAGLPAGVADRLHDEVVAAIEQPTIHARLVEAGVEPKVLSRTAFAEFVAEDVRVTGGAVKAMGLKPG